jgi:hypothetical protein
LGCNSFFLVCSLVFVPVLDPSSLLLPFCSRSVLFSFAVCSIKYRLAPSPEGRPCPGISRHFQAITGNCRQSRASLSHSLARCVFLCPLSSVDPTSEPRVQNAPGPVCPYISSFRVIVSFVSVERLAPYPPPSFSCSRLREFPVLISFTLAAIYIALSERYAPFRDNAVLLRVRDYG